MRVFREEERSYVKDQEPKVTADQPEVQSCWEREASQLSKDQFMKILLGQTRHLDFMFKQGELVGKTVWDSG